LVWFEAERERNHVCSEYTELCGGTYKHQLRVGNECREVRHGAYTEEYQRRIPAHADTLVEDVEHRIVFIQAYFETGVGAERYVSEYYSQSDGYEKQRLKVFLDGKIDECRTHNDHDQITRSGVYEACVGKELVEVLNQKISKSHIVIMLL
jgi:hypothetical protein